MIKNVKHVELNIKYWNYQQKLDEKLNKWFFNKNKFCNHNNNKFILLLKKGVYPYKYMDDRENFYSYLNMEDITVAD